MNLAELIAAAEERRTALQDQLRQLTEDGGAEPDEGQLAAIDEVTQRLGAEDARLATWREAEQRLASTARPATPVAVPGVERNDPTAFTPGQRPFAAVGKKLEPKDYVFRSLAVAVKHHGTKGQETLTDTLKGMYGEDVATKAVMDVVCRAASAPATTTTSGWADSLVQTAIIDFTDALMPNSVYPALRERGGRFTFGQNGIVSIPSRSATPTIAGSFVGQGAPIPVRQAGFSSVTLTPKKMAVITTLTREIMEHSTPAIEAIVRQAIQEDTAVSVDTVLMDATAASTIRPAGLLNGVTKTTASASTGIAGLSADLKALLGALVAGTNGNIRAPVWIMNPVTALAISMMPDGNGNFPFAAEVGAGNLRGIPLITSSTVGITTSAIILVDAADFFSATGDEPRFDVSDQATLHMEDTAPTALSTAGTPNVVAAPIRSLWQTDTVGLRMIMDLNWAMRRSGVVAFIQDAAWD